MENWFKRIKEMFPDKGLIEGYGAFKEYIRTNADAAENIKKAVQMIPSQYIDDLSEQARKLYRPVFKEIKDKQGPELMSLSDFLDATSHLKMFPRTNDGVREFFSEYNFWLKGEKVYHVHPNLCQRFLASNIKAVPTELLRCPFDSFKILLPDKVLPVNTCDSKRIHIRHLFISDFYEPELNARQILIFHRTGEDIGYFQITIDKDQVHECVKCSVEKMREFDEEARKIDPRGRRFEDQDQEDLRVIFEFVMKCILYITGAGADVKWIDESIELKSQLNRVKSTGKRKKLERRLAKAKRMFLVGHTIVLSREEKMMYENVAKGLWSLSYRFIVQGHWRNQPYGPKNQNRKLIFIEPFWKGPAYSEVMNNPHLLK